jgi:hypothetical protein
MLLKWQGVWMSYRQVDEMTSRPNGSWKKWQIDYITRHFWKYLRLSKEVFEVSRRQDWKVCLLFDFTNTSPIFFLFKKTILIKVLFSLGNFKPGKRSGVRKLLGKMYAEAWKCQKMNAFIRVLIWFFWIAFSGEKNAALITKMSK